MTRAHTFKIVFLASAQTIEEQGYTGDIVDEYGEVAWTHPGRFTTVGCTYHRLRVDDGDWIAEFTDGGDWMVTGHGDLPLFSDWFITR